MLNSLTKSAHYDRWDVARRRLKCTRKGCDIGLGEQYRKVSTADLVICVDCAREQFPDQEPPADMPAPAPFQLGPKPSSGAEAVVDMRGLETCRAIGCMGTGERCPRCKRMLPAAIREANGRGSSVDVGLEVAVRTGPLGYGRLG